MGCSPWGCKREPHDLETKQQYQVTSLAGEAESHGFSELRAGRAGRRSRTLPWRGRPAPGRAERGWGSQQLRLPGQPADWSGAERRRRPQRPRPGGRPALTAACRDVTQPRRPCAPPDPQRGWRPEGPRHPASWPCCSCCWRPRRRDGQVGVSRPGPADRAAPTEFVQPASGFAFRRAEQEERRSARGAGEPGSPGKKHQYHARAENLLTLVAGVAGVAGDGGGRPTVVAPGGTRSWYLAVGDRTLAQCTCPHVARSRRPRRGPTDQLPFYGEQSRKEAMPALLKTKLRERVGLAGDGS